MSDKLLILGTKGSAKKTIESIEMQNTQNFEGAKFVEIALLDNYADKDHLFSYPIIGKCDDVEKYRSDYTHAFVCIADNKARAHYIERLVAANFRVPNIIHPLASIAKSTSLGIGILVNAMAIIQSDCTIGNGCVINTGAIVEHDNKLGLYVHIAPNASTTGGVTIGKRTFVGACSCIINRVHIGDNVIIAAGSTVIQDVPDNVMIAGVPAVIKKHLAEKRG